MRVLAANNVFYLKGGSEAVFFRTNALLESLGHTVIPFSVADPRNFSSPYADYFLRDGGLPARASPVAIWRSLTRSLYCREAAGCIGTLADKTQPDLAHLHNVYTRLTGAILVALRKRGIPAVMTVHDPKLVCPSHSLLCRGRICECCAGGAFYHAAVERCSKDSLAASCFLALESYFERVFGLFRRNVDAFIFPSRFLRDKVLQLGFPASPSYVIPNFVPDRMIASEPAEVGDYVLYSGRLSVEKGVDVLLKALPKAPGVPLVIAGDGPARADLERLATVHCAGRVTFRGRLGTDTLDREIRGARFVVVPSVLYENCSMTILEAMAQGKPVLATRIGGSPELIDEPATGLLVTPGDVDDLARGLRELWIAPKPRLAEMGHNCLVRVRARYDEASHYAALMGVYQSVLALKRSGPGHRPRPAVPPKRSDRIGANARAIWFDSVCLQRTRRNLRPLAADFDSHRRCLSDQIEVHAQSAFPWC